MIREQYWYKNYIGHLFIVREFIDIQDCEENLSIGTLGSETINSIVKKDFFLIGVLPASIIKKEDCEILK
jgi:hypothetical protein